MKSETETATGSFKENAKGQSVPELPANVKWDIFSATILFGCCLVFGLLIRWPALSCGYFCWDEHDYIAHNIYARQTLGHFEVPYSNKWPLGHAIVYLLTRPFSPFSIEPYRIAMLAVDAASATLVGLWVGGKRLGRRVGISFVYLMVTSVCLRLSPGVIAENMANLPLIAAAYILFRGRGSSVLWPLSSLSLAAACLVKPTAALPGLGLLFGHFWDRWQNTRSTSFGEIVQLAICSLLIIAVIGGLDWFNVFGAQNYFWTSAVLYNASGSHFGSRPLRDYADVLFSGFAFFQFLTPSLVLGAAAITHFRTHRLDSEEARIFRLATGMAIGASASLFIRPAGGQTTYWLYLLPPLFGLATIGFRSLSSRVEKRFSIAIATISIAPLIYAWALFIYGQPRGLTFGGHGGARVVQTQVEEIEPVVRALTSDPRFKPTRSTLFLWDLQWQMFYFARAIPASSVLTNETWSYSVAREWQERELRKIIDTSADFVVTHKSGVPTWLERQLTRNFTMIFSGENQNVYVKSTLGAQ